MAGGNPVLPLLLDGSLANVIRYAACLSLSLLEASHLAGDLAVLSLLLLPKQAMPGELKHHAFPPTQGLRFVLSLLLLLYSGIFLDFLKFGACFKIAVVRKRLGRWVYMFLSLQRGLRKEETLKQYF